MLQDFDTLKKNRSYLVYKITGKKKNRLRVMSFEIFP